MKHKKNQKNLEKNKEYISPSFNTIAGSGANGAIVHYRADKNNSKKINKKDIFLCDSEDNISMEQLMLQELFVSPNLEKI